ncbi:MAG TPA: hypothetical protein VKG26_03780 [Bacteroidia bacterium]|nr:hypothetical protein [Bacteroidia bacterium]
MEIKSEIELRILNGLLIQARFYDNNYEKKDYYASPVTGTIHKKIIDELRMITFNDKLIYYPNEDDFFIERYHDSSIWLNNIKAHVTNIDNWRELSLDLRKDITHNFIYPFILSQVTFDEICNYNLEENSIDNFREFLEEQREEYGFLIKKSTKISELGLVGVKGIQFINSYGEKFNVDISNFFSSKIADITIEQLEKGIIEGKLINY